MTKTKLVVKKVHSTDQLLCFEHDGTYGRPNEVFVVLSSIAAQKLGHPKSPTNQTDEIFAREAYDFLRNLLVGKTIDFTEISSMANDKKLGVVEFDGVNVAHLLLKEGLAKVRVKGNANTDEMKALVDCEEVAKAAGKGLWGANANQQPIHTVKQLPKDKISEFFEKKGKQLIKGYIEYFAEISDFQVCLLPDYTRVNVKLTGIECPKSELRDLYDEGKFFVERRLLQRDIQVRLDSTDTNGFFGTIVHPQGNISEVLLREGFAKTVLWSLGALNPEDKKKLLDAEAYGREHKNRWWAMKTETAPVVTGKGKEYQATVVEVVNGDSLMVKAGAGPAKKIFLSSIRPPRSDKDNKDNKAFRALYDIPWLFEAREFLRKKLVGKKVNVFVDYIQPAKAENQYPEKVCCTVTIGGINVAEALLMKGLATFVRHGRADNDRSSCYDALKAAEEKAQKSKNGLHSAQTPILRITDVSTDQARAKTFLSSLQRSGRVEAVVEFASSGSRLRIYIPKEACLATFLLAGINCPRASRIAGPQPAPGEPFGDDALAFTREKCLQRDVEIKVDSVDKVGNFIGWLWVDNTNLAVALVEEGLAKVHFSGEKSEHSRALKQAQESAINRRAKLWKDYVPEEAHPDEKTHEEETVAERNVDYQEVVVTEVTRELKFYAQSNEQGPQLEALMNKVREEFHQNPPLPGAYTPRRGDLCAAKFSDDEWYRARVEKVQDKQVHVLYIDYGNREITTAARCAALPGSFTTDKPYVTEFTLAFVKLPSDVEYQKEAYQAFRDDALDRPVLLNVEYKIEKTIYATLACRDTKTDIGKSLVADGFLMVDQRREKRLAKIISEYKAAEEEAKKHHKVIWQYGDITEDDAKEFGLSR